MHPGPSPPTLTGKLGAAPPEELRRKLRLAIEAWLDEALAGPDQPGGLAAEVLAELESGEEPAGEAGPGEDLFGLWSAMTVLAQEVKLQGRYFKQLHESLSARDAPEPELLARAIEDLRQLAREQERQIEKRAWREAITLLVDLRDRLVRGRDRAKEQLGRLERAEPSSWLARLEQPSGWLARLLPGHASRDLASVEAVLALAEGYAMSLARLEETLDQQGVREVPCSGRLFDPQTMMAVDIEQTAAHTDGTVVDVYAPGYLWRGEILRTARVRVARACPRNEEEER